jgi:hypothetical protein
MNQPAEASPMEQLSKDPLLAPILNNNRGAKLHDALRARLALENNATRKRLIEEVLANRRWFLEPIAKAPSLSTVNGIGTMLYGESEKEPDGTHIATLCFVFFFIPLVPIAQYLVQSMGGRKWTFYGKVPTSKTVKRWRQVVALGAVAAGLAIAFSVMEGRGHSNVHFVNGLDVPVKIQAGKLSLRVAANDRVMKRMKKDSYSVRVTTDDGRLIEEEKVAVPGAYDVVAYNVLGAAALYQQPVTYTTARLPGESKDEPVFAVGKRFIAEDHVNFVFSEPPSTISMSKGQMSTTRHRFDVARGGWKLSAAILLSQKRPEDAARLVEAVAALQPNHENTMMVATTVVERARGPAGMAAFVSKLADSHPESVELQRLAQNVLLAQGKRAELIARYRERADQHPESASAAYLAARVRPLAERAALFQELAKKFPDDVNVRRSLAWTLLQTRRFSEAAEAFALLGKLPHQADPEELENQVQALVALKRAGEAARLVAGVARKGGDHALLYARVALVAGKDAPHPPDRFIAEKGAQREWYVARYGAPDRWKTPKAALEAFDEGDADSLGREYGLLLAADALRLDDKPRADAILDELSPAVNDAERAAIFEGKDSPELSELPLGSQAVLELARAWRVKGAEARKLIEQARADDLLQGAAAVGLSWK